MHALLLAFVLPSFAVAAFGLVSCFAKKFCGTRQVTTRWSSRLLYPWNKQPPAQIKVNFHDEKATNVNVRDEKLEIFEQCVVFHHKKDAKMSNFHYESSIKIMGIYFYPEFQQIIQYIVLSGTNISPSQIGSFALKSIYLPDDFYQMQQQNTTNFAKPSPPNTHKKLQKPTASKTWSV